MQHVCSEQAVEREPDLAGVQGQAEQEGGMVPEDLPERELHPCSWEEHALQAPHPACGLSMRLYVCHTCGEFAAGW